MIHIATTHGAGPKIVREHRKPADRWIETQFRYLDKHVNASYRVYACLDNVENEYAAERFFFSCPSLVRIDDDGRTGLARNLNHLAGLIMQEAAPDDSLLFLDGDAFPIAGLVGPVEALLRSAPLVAIRRDENLQDPVPHSSFCATTVGFWQEIRGDWSVGTWRNAAGNEVTDVGGNLWKNLRDRKIAWTPLLRSNLRDLHPVLFGCYGNLVYHHGAGFRRVVTRRDEFELQQRVEALPLPFSSKLYTDLLTARVKENERLSEQVFREIQRNENFAEELLLTPASSKSEATPTAPTPGSG
jgi:hypothetical protein